MSKRSKGAKKKCLTNCKRRVYCKSKYRCYLRNKTTEKVQNKDCQECNNKKVYKNKHLKSNLLNSNRKNNWDSSEYKRKKYGKPIVGPLQHVFYSIVNTNICMDEGTTAAAVGRCLIALHSKLDADDAKYQYIDTWNKSGQSIIVLKGYDHKHLQYLLREAKYSAIATHPLIKKWDSCKQIIVLSIFGIVEDLQDMLDGLSPL